MNACWCVQLQRNCAHEMFLQNTFVILCVHTHRDQWLTLMDHSRNHSVIGSCSVDGVYRCEV